MLFRSGSTPISETTTGCLVTTVDEKTNDAYFFYKFPNENWPQTKEDYSRKNLAMATSAIPYVFGPCAVKSLDNPMKKFSGVDGSLCMVDPSLEAYAVASKILKGYDKRIPIEMVTITCGHADDKATKRTDPLTKFLWPYLESDMKENRKLLEFMDVKNTYIDVPLSNAYAPMYTMIFSTEAMQKDLIKQTDKYLDNCAAFQKLVKKLKVEKTDFDSL